jgi:hypothetical protein
MLLACITLLLLLSLVYASPSGYIDIDQFAAKTKYATSLIGGEACNDRQLKAISDGFDEMNRLFSATVDIDWAREAEREFFGQEERIGNLTALVEGNLERVRRFALGVGVGVGEANGDIRVRWWVDDCNRTVWQCL